MPKKKYNILFSGMSAKKEKNAGKRASSGRFPRDSFDIYRPKGVLFIIADCIGSIKSAYRLNCFTMKFISREYFPSVSNIISSSLFWAFKILNLKICQMSRHNPKLNDVNISCSALVLYDNYACIAHTGNTAVFRITDRSFERLTVMNKKINGLTAGDTASKAETSEPSGNSDENNDLDFAPDLEVDIIKDIPINSGDSFVLCTSGFTEINHDDFQNIVMNYIPETACRNLITLANKAGIKDNLTIQIIKITTRHEKHPTSISEITKQLANVDLRLLIVLISITVALIAGIFYHNSLFTMFKSPPVTVENLPAEKIIKVSSDERGIPEQEINSYPGREERNNELNGYGKGINKYPGQKIEERKNGHEKEKLIEKDNSSFSERDLNTSPGIIKNTLADNTENSLTGEKKNKVDHKQKKQVEPYPKSFDTKGTAGFAVKAKRTADDKAFENTKSELSSGKFNPGKWIAPGLTGKDYKADINGITFYGSNKIKRIISTSEMKDINIEAEIRFADSSADSRAGIIIGYNSAGSAVKNNYLLFTADFKGNFSLSDITNGSSRILKTVNKAQELNEDKKHFKIKLKSLGPWVILYLDNKLLESWYGKDFIKGKIGLFAGANTAVKFTSIKISHAFGKN